MHHHRSAEPLDATLSGGAHLGTSISDWPRAAGEQQLATARRSRIRAGFARAPRDTDRVPGRLSRAAHSALSGAADERRLASQVDTGGDNATGAALWPGR